MVIESIECKYFDQLDSPSQSFSATKINAVKTNPGSDPTALKIQNTTIPYDKTMLDNLTGMSADKNFIHTNPYMKAPLQSNCTNQKNSITQH